MKKLRTIAGLTFATLALCGATAPSPAPSTEISAGATHETLTNGYPPWDSQYLTLTSRNGAGRVVYGELDSWSRFGKNDDQFTLGAYVPAGERWLAFTEASTSPTHDVLPSYALSAGIQYDSGSHWFESVAVRHTSYNVASVNSGIFDLEHYWGVYRINYSVTAAQVSGAGTDVEHSVDVDRYYGAMDSYVRVGYTVGREVENAGLPALLTSHVDGWNVGGRHWMNAHWALVYGFGTFVQGASYTRTGGQLGLDYRL